MKEAHDIRFHPRRRPKGVGRRGRERDVGNKGLLSGFPEGGEP